MTASELDRILDRVSSVTEVANIMDDILNEDERISKRAHEEDIYKFERVCNLRALRKRFNKMKGFKEGMVVMQKRNTAYLPGQKYFSDRQVLKLLNVTTSGRWEVELHGSPRRTKSYLCPLQMELIL